MSRSPRAHSSRAGLDEYIAGWGAIRRLLRQGQSWSGFERNCAFLNLQGSRFANVSAISGLDFPDDGRGLAVVDWDHDGDLDLWFANRTGPRLRLMLNQGETTASFVAFELRGIESNRDAIGARVELELPGRNNTMIETVYAGDGFLSQSSKIIHFGLGRTPKIDRVTVRWPNGKREDFSGVEPGRRHLLVEGTGLAAELEWSRGELALEASPQEPPSSSTATRLFLPVRVPLPPLEYRPFAPDSTHAGERRIVATRSRALLLNLWASWCLPCVGELEEFASREDELRGAGLDILALSVDGLGEDPVTRPADAERLISRLRFPFSNGLATPALLDKIELVEEVLYDRDWAFSIPVSFLLHPNGELSSFIHSHYPFLTVEFPPKFDN